MDILVRPATGSDVTSNDFADITDVPVTSIEWAEDGQLCVTFESDLTAEQVQRVRLRITSSDPAEEQMRVVAAAYLTLDAPTAAQTIAQVKRITRLVLTLDDGA